jgi:hypothetical protein
VLEAEETWVLYEWLGNSVDLIADLMMLVAPASLYIKLAARRENRVWIFRMVPASAAGGVISGTTSTTDPDGITFSLIRREENRSFKPLIHYKHCGKSNLS